MLSSYTATNFYIAKRVFRWFSLLFPNISGKIFAFIYISIAFSLLFGFLPLPSGIKRILGWVGAHWIGIFVYLLIFFLVADLVVMSGSFIKIIPAPVPQKIRLYAGIIVFLLTSGLVGYGLYNAGHITCASYDIQTKKASLPADIKIVLISDLHLGAVNSEKNLSRIARTSIIWTLILYVWPEIFLMMIIVYCLILTK